MYLHHPAMIKNRRSRIGELKSLKVTWNKQIVVWSISVPLWVIDTPRI
jgi:hypothetical protein